MQLVAGAFHAAAASIMAYGFLALETLPINELITLQYGGHFQFLTIQGLAITFFTMVIALASDIFPSIRIFKQLKRAAFMLALPLAVTISTIYWSLVLLAPKLILQMAPSASDTAPLIAQIPLKIDLSLHAAPGIALLLDFFTTQHKYSKSEVRWAPFVAGGAAAFYGWWVEQCGRINGVFPYPFLTHNSLEGRVAIYVGAALLAFGGFRAINGAHA